MSEAPGMTEMEAQVRVPSLLTKAVAAVEVGEAEKPLEVDGTTTLTTVGASPDGDEGMKTTITEQEAVLVDSIGVGAKMRITKYPNGREYYRFCFWSCALS